MGLLHTQGCGPVAIVGSETGSVFFDPHRAAEDSGQLINLIQMGDGAAACVLASEVTTSAAQVSRVFHGYSGWGLEPGFSLTSGGSDFAPTPGSIPEFAHDYASVAEHGAGLFMDGLVAARQLGIERSAVSYFGDPGITYQWQGATYLFSTAEHREAFKADPAHYAPQFGGYCAFAVSRGTTADADPHQWAIVDGKLYVNNNAFARKLWDQDRPGNIVAGDANWPLIPKRPLATGQQSTAVSQSAPAPAPR